MLQTCRSYGVYEGYFGILHIRLKVVYTFLADLQGFNLVRIFQLLFFGIWPVDNPERGDVITNTGGFRKLQWLNYQWRKSQHGGLRIIYYHLAEEKAQEQFIFFITLYDNKESADLTSEQKEQMKRAITNEKFFRRRE